MTDATLPSNQPAPETPARQTAPSRTLQRILKAAWLAIIAGLVLQTLVLVAKLMADGPFPGMRLVVDVAGGVTWAVLVCAGVALGASAAKARSAMMGILGLMSAPAAFAATKGVQKGVAEVLGLPADQITPLVYMIGAARTVEYAVLGIGLGWLLLKSDRGWKSYAALGLAVGVVFGGIILALTLARSSPPTPAIAGIAVNEIVFPAMCAVIIYLVSLAGRHVGIVKSRAE